MSTTYHIEPITASPNRDNINRYQIWRHIARESWSPWITHVADTRDYKRAQAIVAAFEAFEQSTPTTHHNAP